MRRLSALPVALVFAACAGGAIGTADPRPVAPRGVPGFDTREYPGDAAMAAWRRDSPYRWVGYYLESPCRPRSTWMGRRAALASDGWGLAVLYVGEQQWADTASHVAPADSVLRCSRRNLTAERGTADAIDAEQRAAAEGFAAGSVVFLNVERVEQVGPELAAYIQAWVGTLHERGRFRPGIYVHERNAESIYARALAELNRRGSPIGPPLWVAKGSGFSLEAAPRESGIQAARIWQGTFDVHETWGGATIRIDANVADRTSPSDPAG